MSDLTRAEEIESLEDLSRRYENAIHDYYGIARIEVHKDECEAVKVGIGSLKTDETYQIEYEKRDFIEIPEGATNGDLIKAMIHNRENIHYGMNGEYYRLWSNDGNLTMTCHTDWWNSSYRKEQE